MVLNNVAVPGLERRMHRFAGGWGIVVNDEVRGALGTNA